MAKLQPIFKEYISYVTTYKEKYGEQTVVLMQVGSFYEIYAILNDNEKLGEINIYHICQNLMNISVANKTSHILMGGFQLPYSSKFIKLLIDHNYTVVLVHQVSEPPNPERKVTDIISPGTYIEDFNGESNNYMMSVYIEQISSWTAVGISIIDISTGKNYVYQIGENLDTNYWKDELNRLISYYAPKEFLFQLHNMILTKDDIINYWDIQNATVQLNHYSDSTYESVSYQNELLQKVFELETLLTPIDQLGLIHKHELRKSYIYMLQYINEHKVDLLRNINLPEDIDNIHHLSLTSNSVRQLNVINNYSYYKGKNESLFSICDDCGFIGGKRLLKERLLYPSINTDILQLRYDRVDCMIDTHFYKELKENIHKLTDLDKSLRKMGLGMLEPSQFLTSKLSYDFINRIICTMKSKATLADLYSEYEPTIESYKDIYAEIVDTFNFNNFYSAEHSYFNEGLYPDIDCLEKDIIHITDQLQYISTRLSSIIDAHNSCKFDHNDKYGYFLYCTKKRSTLLSSRLKNIPKAVLNVRDSSNKVIFEIESNAFTYKSKDNTNVFIECTEINELTTNLRKSVQKMKTINQMYWSQTMNSLFTKYNPILQKLHQFISDIDVSSTIAKISVQNKYCKPELIDNSKSCVVAQDIRHPIVERISVDSEYITNDIILGKDNKDGLLLFGTNACGKSTLMKAIGLNVIMAQAGFYVPCKSFQLKPYTKIFTRILNNDNIFRSQSSFAVEMIELRSIFQLSDENSLILGDELCSGTETLSAISIVSKSIDILSTKKSSYIITSHLHQLNDIPLIKSIPNLDIYHLKITYDNGVLTYNRKLCVGSGPPIYGLKVCEAMGLADEFIKGANDILKSLTEQSKDIVKTKQSQYNKDVFMDECKVCKGAAEETHHIKEQCTSDENNMIDHHHKNKKHNLVPLCKECHAKVTYGGLLIYGWKQTSRGPQLDYEYVAKQVTKPKKFTDEQIKIILSYKELVDEGLMNKVTCMNTIDSKYGFRPSSKIISEVFKGIY
jgi:DNA mismatch repair protein MutS